MILAALVAAGLFHVEPAIAQGGCGTPIEEIDAQLHKDYGESVAVQMLSKNGYQIRVYVNPETRTFTILAYAPNGCLKMLDSGENFEGVPPRPFPGPRPESDLR